MSYDQAFQTTGAYATAAKYPYILFADQEKGSSGGYVNNSLEGLLFNQFPLTTGTITIPAGTVTPKWNFYESPVETPKVIQSVSISNNICTVVCSASTGFLVGDVVSISGIQWATSPFINACWVVKSVSQTNVTNDTFTFEITAPNDGSFSYSTPRAMKGPVFDIKDNRAVTDAKGRSFTSILFTPKNTLFGSTGYRRILPSDLYLRFRFQTGSDTNPQGGINSNLFNVLDASNNNIKPALWAYFFGYSSSDLPSTRNATHFEIAFNSYAIVLRPTGSGSRLEFALLKFNWGQIPTGYWMSSIVDTEKFSKYTISGTELGYLISTNPVVGQVAGIPVVTEIAVSDSFTYDSEFALKLNLKITIRKHLLSDSELDKTYLVNLMVNDTYEDFGPGKHYDSILHGYITKPDPNVIITSGTYVDDLRLAPILYFKFNNINEQNVNLPAPAETPPRVGSSKIVLDNLFFRQINSSTDTPYLY